ncbi:hypothetical protein [Tropicimonas sp.]|uniref:hypothetical protein n=1 Tax=Tropicimonas sp. TaxID=2067044 RepID=UPI003A864D1C
MAQPVIDRLAALRKDPARIAAGGALLADFLDTALDKHEGRYDYGTYLALRMLGIRASARPGLSRAGIEAERDILLCGLIAGIMRAELYLLDDDRTATIRMRPDAVQPQRRLGLALRAIRPSIGRRGITLAPEAGDDAAARTVVAATGEWLGAQRRLRLDLSLLPVHAIHDEILFLRVLQGFELGFAWIAVLLREAAELLAQDAGAATERLDLANTLLRETMRLFPLLGDMDVEAFRNFRRFTEGASAIQSASYKTIEALCRRPDADRLGSVAFAAVPEVRRAAESGQTTLDGAFALACREGRLAGEDRAAFVSGMRIFAGQLQRWRQAHHALARRFLGEGAGTGYTSGVPYLTQGLHLPVFRELPTD